MNKERGLIHGEIFQLEKVAFLLLQSIHADVVATVNTDNTFDIFRKPSRQPFQAISTFIVVHLQKRKNYGFIADVCILPN